MADPATAAETPDPRSPLERLADERASRDPRSARVFQLELVGRKTKRAPAPPKGIGSMYPDFRLR